MIRIQSSVSKGWLHTKGGFSFPERYYLDPLFRLEQDLLINRFVRDQFPRYAIYNMEDNLVQAPYVKDNHVLVGAIQPNMILAALLGAKFSFYETTDSDVAGRPLENIASKDELPKPEMILEHELVKDLDRQIDEIKTMHPGLRVIPPFFWDESGRATIHGIITTSLKLTGDNIMTLMMADPELAHAIHQWIVDSYIILIQHFAKSGNLTVTSVHVGECAGTMISPDLYDEFVVPYISMLGERLGPIRLHSCGISDHLLEPASHISNLKVFDTGSGTSIARIRAIMGQDFEINIFPPTEVLRMGSPASMALDWLSRTLEENGGGPLQIAFHLEPEYVERNGIAIHEELFRRGLVRPGREF
jgi:hypothetical protein